MSSADDDISECGWIGGAGSFICQGCSFPVSFEPSESIPRCPNCGGTDFRRTSLFEQPTLVLGNPKLGPVRLAQRGAAGFRDHLPARGHE